MRDESDAERGIGKSGAGARVGGRDGWGERVARCWEASDRTGWRVRIGIQDGRHMPSVGKHTCDDV
jgi:hypothetical protein